MQPKFFMSDEERYNLKGHIFNKSKILFGLKIPSNLYEKCLEGP